ncbi:hypothetical protein [Sporomusa sp. KB1]|uniref:hypothetical protein n=1 Tax=Sporomusa sp. KB1 TaxID=943346 RepID=UPI0011A5C11A|nr:hypothetical protein [Sporomusa sp. KB1]TWH48558.1 hypothetical protein Salpa_4723 [Sporomusa sp. KB1]
MPYLKGTATDHDDLLRQIIDWTTDETIHGTDAWELMRNEPWPRGTILKAHGWREGEHQYIGFLHTPLVKGKTYKEWFLTEKILSSEFLWGQQGINSKPGINYYQQVKDGAIIIHAAREIVITNGMVTIYTKNNVGTYVDAISYSFFPAPELFETSSHPMFLGVFKQYSQALDWHQQAGGERRTIHPKPLKYYISGSSHPFEFNPPLYPGVGYPAISCALEGFENGYADFWLIKDRSRMILVVNNGGCWEVGYLGFIEPYHKPEEYIFPACTIGGTSGVIPVGETVPVNTPEIGYRFDYTPQNWSLSHGNPTYAATPWTGNNNWLDEDAISQVQIMLPDGQWQSFANWAIKTEIIVIIGPAYFYPHKEPDQPQGLRHYIRPTYSNIGLTTHVYDNSKTTYQLEPIEFVQSRSNQANILGKLWRIFWPSYPIYKFGEQVIEGKRHLIIPNSWDWRRFHIPHGRTYIVDPLPQLAQDQRMQVLSNAMNIVVRLED